jgi:hypothetical protein
MSHRRGAVLRRAGVAAAALRVPHRGGPRVMRGRVADAKMNPCLRQRERRGVWCASGARRGRAGLGEQRAGSRGQGARVVVDAEQRQQQAKPAQPPGPERVEQELD